MKSASTRDENSFLRRSNSHGSGRQLCLFLKMPSSDLCPPAPPGTTMAQRPTEPPRSHTRRCCGTTLHTQLQLNRAASRRGTCRGRPLCGGGWHHRHRAADTLEPTPLPLKLHRAATGPTCLLAPTEPTTTGNLRKHPPHAMPNTPRQFWQPREGRRRTMPKI